MNLDNFNLEYLQSLDEDERKEFIHEFLQNKAATTMAAFINPSTGQAVKVEDLVFIAVIFAIISAVVISFLIQPNRVLKIIGIVIFVLVQSSISMFLQEYNVVYIHMPYFIHNLYRCFFYNSKS
jgi:hypothetical protein